MKRLVAIAGVMALAMILFVDPVPMLKVIGFPADKLNKARVLTEITILREFAAIMTAGLLGSAMLLWSRPEFVSLHDDFIRDGESSIYLDPNILHVRDQ